MGGCGKSLLAQAICSMNKPEWEGVQHSSNDLSMKPEKTAFYKQEAIFIGTSKSWMPRWIHPLARSGTSSSINHAHYFTGSHADIGRDTVTCNDTGIGNGYGDNSDSGSDSDADDGTNLSNSVGFIWHCFRRFYHFDNYQFQRFARLKEHIRRSHEVTHLGHRFSSKRGRDCSCQTCSRAWNKDEEAKWEALWEAISLQVSTDTFVKQLENLALSADIEVETHNRHHTMQVEPIVPEFGTPSAMYSAMQVDDWGGSKTIDPDYTATMTGKLEVGDIKRLYSCPFFKSNPSAYEQCRRISLSSVEAIKAHLEKHHAAPIHCARCYAEFHTAGERDMHLRSVDCGRKEPRELEGYDEMTRRLIEMQTDTTETMFVQWNAIFNVLFPGQSLPLSPFVDSEFAEAVLTTECAKDGQRVSKYVPL